MSQSEPRRNLFDPIGYFVWKDLEAVVIDTGSHWLTAWIATGEGGRPRLVGLELLPPRAFTESAKRDYFRLFATEQLPERYTEFSPIATLESVQGPLRAARWTSILQARQLLRSQAQELGPDDLQIFEVEDRSALEGLSQDQLKRLDALADALLFSEAVRRGDHNPAQVIADARTISIRTAHGRVGRARKLGFLTEARRGAIGGELTPEARDFLSDAKAIARSSIRLPWEESKDG